MPTSCRQRLEGYLDRLYGYAITMARDREQARDLVQECALRALAARRVPADEAAFRAWLFRILRNLFLDGRRRQEVRERHPSATPQDDALQPILPGDHHLIDRLAVQQALRELSEAHREIVTLIDVAGFSYAEAAELLGIPRGTVMSRLARARTALLSAISNEDPLADNVADNAAGNAAGNVVPLRGRRARQLP